MIVPDPSPKVGQGYNGYTRGPGGTVCAKSCHVSRELSPGFRRVVGGDGYDGDAQGSRFWAVRHGPLGEAPFSAPQARKILGPKAVLLDF